MSPSRSRGQHAGLDAAAILEAATELVDRDGLGSLSMRRLGAELGVEAMALYHHFPNKDALLDALVGNLVAEATLSRTPEGWRDQLRRYGLAFFRTLTAHPNLVPLVLTRPVLTPSNLAIMETLVESLCEEGFAPERALDMVYAVGRLALAHAVLATGTDEALAAGGSDPALRLADVDPTSYPSLSAAAKASRGRPATYRLEFALDALVAGFAEPTSISPAAARAGGGRS